MSAPRPHPQTHSPSQHEPILPPVPFDDFQFFNPGFHSAGVPPPLSLPPSNELFSASETTDLFGFLENFDWDFNADAFPQIPDVHSSDPLYRNPLQETAPPGLDQLPPSSNLFISQPDPPQQHQHQQFHQLQTPQPPPPPQQPSFNHNVEANPPMRSRSRSASTSSSPSQSTPSASVGPRVKPLLSTPQKRLNHIMSEQKRRNAIRDGYLQLTTLLAPVGAPPGSGMPTRGRPKGSGSRGRGTKGKSGILFRARAYIQWLEEGRDALMEEVTRVGAAAGIR